MKFGRVLHDVAKLDERSLRARNAIDVARDRVLRRQREEEAERWIAEVRARKVSGNADVPQVRSADSVGMRSSGRVGSLPRLAVAAVSRIRPTGAGQRRGVRT